MSQEPVPKEGTAPQNFECVSEKAAEIPAAAPAVGHEQTPTHADILQGKNEDINVPNSTFIQCPSSQAAIKSDDQLLLADPAAVIDHLTALYGRCPPGSGLIEIVWDAYDEDTRQWKLNQWARFPVADIASAAACAVKAANRGSRVYVGMGLRRTDMLPHERSTNADCVLWPAAVWDFDDMESAQPGLEKAKEAGLGFSYVVQTGAIRNGEEKDLRAQCWAFMREPITDAEVITRLQREGICSFGSDKSIHDPRRVMRLCGTVAWARKDGRVDEMTRRREDLESFDGFYTPSGLETLLGAVAPVPKKPVSEETIRKLQVTLEASGGVAQLWAGAPAAQVPLSDLIEGNEMNPSLFTLAQMAARRGHPSETIQVALTSLLDDSAAQTSRPDRVEQLYGQLPDIVKRAVADAGGEGAPPVANPAEDFDGAEVALEAIDPHTLMFSSCVYVKNCGGIFDTRNRTLYTKEKLFSTAWSPVGVAASSSRSAFAIFINENAVDDEIDPGRRQVADAACYMPNTGVLFDLDGVRYVNTWTPASNLNLPDSVTDADAGIWLSHARYLCGQHAAEHIFDWMAFTLQHPEKKINHALLIKSRHHGVGKNQLLPPLFHGLGRDNWQTISGENLVEGFTAYLDGRKLITIDELATADRRDTAQKLKTILATVPGGTLSIRKMRMDPYEVPNIVQMIFFSNLDNPILIEESDRRFFVVDSDVEPREDAYYQALADFYKKGGKDIVVRWLLQRDGSQFNYAGPAPETEAKKRMQVAALPPLEQVTRSLIEDEAYPFCTDLVSLAHAATAVQGEIRGRGSVTAQHLSPIIARAGGWVMPTRQTVNGRVAGLNAKKITIAAVRNAETYP